MPGTRESFVGRDRELSVLREVVDDAASGRTRLAMLIGEPGIGKTRLADELADDASAREFQVSWGRCWEAGDAPAFWPWSQALNPLARDIELEPDRVDALAKRTGLLGQVVTSLRAGLVDFATLPSSARLEQFQEVVEFLQLATESSPLLLVLDDIHVADLSSLQLLQFVGRALRSARLAIVACYRDVEARVRDEARTTIAGIEREGVCLRLPRLNRDESAALMETVGGKPSYELAHAVYEKTQGNPLFVGELSEWLRSEGAFEADAAPSSLPIPFGVTEAIRQRLSALSSESRELLSIASVFGRELDPRVLAAVAGLEIEQTRAALRDAEALGAISAVGPGAYRFRHILICEALYQELPELRRVELHANVALALERIWADDSDAPLATLASHFLAAAPQLGFERAVDVAIEAAERDSQRLAFEDAISMLQRMLAAAEDAHAPGAARARLMTKLAQVQMAAGQLDDARATCRHVFELTRSLGAHANFASAVLAYGDHLTVGAVDQLLVDLLVEALDRLGDSDSVLRAKLMARLAAARTPSLEPAADQDLAREAIEIGRTVNDPADRLEILYWAMSSLMDYEDPWKRADVNLETERLALRLGAKHRLLRARARLVMDYLEQGDAGRAWDAAERFDSVTAELNQPRFSWQSASFRAMRANLEGRFEDAERAMAEARELAARAGGGPEVHLCWQRLGHELARERADAAANAATEFYDLIHYFLPELPALFVSMGYSRFGDVQRAKDLLARVSIDRVLPQSDPAVSMPIAEFAVLTGDLELARRCYHVMVKDRHRAGCWGISAQHCDLPVERYLALLAECIGDLDVVEDHFHAAETQLRAMGARPGLSRTLYEHARFLLRHGKPSDRDRATELSAESRRIGGELGLDELVARVDALGAGPQVEVAAPAVPTAAPFELVRDGDMWRIRCAEGEFHFKNTRGMRLLNTLIESPGVEHHVLDLSETRGDSRQVAGDSGELLDAEAKAAYRARVADLREQLDEAESFSDLGRAARIREELEAIEAELSRAFGLGGRARKAGAAAERARSAVQRRIKDAIKKIEHHAPRLAEHLDWAVNTGVFCVYRPGTDG